MIFEQETVAFQILDVLYLDQINSKSYNTNRNFDALSFRLEADTVIECNGIKTEFTDNSICYASSHVDYTRIAEKDKLIVVHFESFNYHSTHIESFYPAEHEKYALLFKEILECWNKKEISYKHDASALLCNIFAKLYMDNQKNYLQNSKIDLSVRYMEENCFNKDFSLTVAAEKSFISDTYFRKLFKEEFGISPKQYIIKKRIKYAASLIIAGYYTLPEISEMCGYNDYKHFSVEFKKIMGISPSKYIYNYWDSP